MGKSILIVSAMMLLMACEERKLVVKTQPLPFPHSHRTTCQGGGDGIR